MRLLCNPRCPVQLILAGKAHPQDVPGQDLIKQWKDFIKRPEVQGRVVFLNDYDMMLAQELVQGIDLWINTPRRPWEACGTSGMKVLVNGGLESFRVGWLVGGGLYPRSWLGHWRRPVNMAKTSGWDAKEADTFCIHASEREVIPEFYERDKSGMPVQVAGTHP